MKLTALERIMLINQFSIRKAVEKTNDYDETIEVLEKGYELLYDEKLTGWLYEPMPAERARFVFDVLAMYGAIEHYKREHPQDAEIAKVHGSHFLGFDGNNEGDYFGFARWAIERPNQWDDLKPYKDKKWTDGFNSHARLVPFYERLLAKWRELGEPATLTAEQVRAILGA